MQQVVDGTATGNTFRIVGNLLGGGGGLGSVVVGGAADALTGNPLAWGLPAVGWGARALFNASP